ncbi:condensation domain-containing protein, partial [Sinomicrobium oceani]|uniref:condensation domain-containing protein n=1 Tax=Sinomicrobium oceani TaxID=1150368 RepID=UPI0038B4BDFE
MNIHIFFNELRLNTGAIWFENNLVKFSAPKKFQNQDTDNFITENKGQISAILNENKIYSKEKFLNTIILRDNLITEYPLSPAQQRLWFIEQYEQGTNAYHMPMVVELAPGTDRKGIEHALQEIVKRHQVLRSTIELGDHGKGIQVVHDGEVQIEEMLLSDK